LVAVPTQGSGSAHPDVRELAGERAEASAVVQRPGGGMRGGAQARDDDLGGTRLASPHRIGGLAVDTFI
jgi:hypothetical protein